MCVCVRVRVRVRVSSVYIFQCQVLSCGVFVCVCVCVTRLDRLDQRIAFGQMLLYAPVREEEKNCTNHYTH